MEIEGLCFFSYYVRIRVTIIWEIKFERMEMKKVFDKFLLNSITDKINLSLFSLIISEAKL